MGKSIEIERLEGRGITAKVTNDGKQFTTYYDFANAAGYSDAVGYGKGGELRNRLHEAFKVKAKGEHETKEYGEIYVIESNDGKRFLIGKDGLDIFEKEDEGEASSLESRNQVEELIAEMRRQAYAEGFAEGLEQGEGSRSAREFLEESRRETAQERRDQIVERAKKDIEGLKEHIYEWEYVGIAYRVKTGELYKRGKGRYAACDVDFIVNKDKRTVVALMKGVKSKKLFARGIAKCAPEDCFNEHIGKIIALRRALGLGIPYDYVFTPQPTEVRIGNIVRSEQIPSLEPYEVARVYGKYVFSVGGGYAPAENVTVIDDSKSEEGER